MAHSQANLSQSTAHSCGYLPDDPGAFLCPDTPNARKELEDLAPHAARFVDAFRVQEHVSPAPGEDGSAYYLEARRVLADSRLAFLEHAERVGPRALRALERFVRERPGTGADLARAEDALRKELEEDAGRVKLEPGSVYRSTSNPNPDGYTVEDLDWHTDRPYGERLPALNVKAYPDLNRVDYADVCADLGLDSGTLAPTGKEDEDGEPEVLPFGADWIRGRYDDGTAQDLYDGPDAWAREAAWDDAREAARELFGDLPGVGNVEVWSAGRSGGWATVQGLPDLEELEELEERANGEEVQEAEEAREELERILGAWAEFEARGRATVEDLGRAIAWHVGANVFEHEAREYAEELERIARVRALVAERVPALAGLRVLEDADPDELEAILDRADD